MRKNRSNTILTVMSAFLLVILVSCERGKVGREKSRKRNCIVRLKQIGSSLKKYAELNGGKFPPLDDAKGLDLLRSSGVLAEPLMYICPSTTVSLKRGEELTDESVSFHYRGGLSLNDSPNTPIAWDKLGNHEDYGNILFLNGEVKSFSGKEWMNNTKK